MILPEYFSPTTSHKPEDTKVVLRFGSTAESTFDRWLQSTLDRWLHAHFSLQIQFDWLKISFSDDGFSKNRLNRCWRKNKASISHNNYSKKIWLKFSSKVFAEQKRSEQQFMLHTDNNLKNVYKENTSSSYIYVSSIDQGAKRLGGLEFSIILC